jgi:hypothetical protein
MQAFMEPRLINIISASDKASAMPAQSEKCQTGIATRFLAILLSCLSAWGT